MKYLHTYKSSIFPNIQSTILDIFSDMIDDGLLVEVFLDEDIDVISVMITYTLPPYNLFNKSSDETKTFISMLWDLSKKKRSIVDNPIIRKIEDMCELEMQKDEYDFYMTPSGGITTLKFDII